MDADGAAPVKHMLGQCQSIHRGLLRSQLGNDILQVHGRAGAGLARQDQELIDVAGVQGSPALVDQAVFVPVVNGAQAGTVAQLGAQLGEFGVKVRHVYLAQACLAKLGSDVLHLARNGGVVVGGCHVIGTDLNEHERIAVILKVELELLGFRLSLVLKVHVGKAAQAHSGLVHQTAGLAVIVVLGALAHLSERDGLNGGRAPERLHGTAVRGLDGGRAGKATARGDGAGEGEVEALGLNAQSSDFVGHTAHEACGRALLGRLNIQRVERDLKRGVALVGDADLVGVGRYGDAVDSDIERAGDNVAALVIGVVATDFGTAGRVHVEHLAVADGAKLLLK